jgi:hypothetical protein
MGSHGTKTGERSARDTDEMMLNGKDGFLDHGQAALEEQVVNPHDRSGQRVFDRGEKRVGGAFGYGREGGLKRRAGHGGNSATEKLDGGGFAESPVFALESNAYGLAVGCAHRQALSCNKGRKTKSKDSFRAGKTLPERIGCSDATFSYEENRQPKWLLRFPEVEI